MKNLLLGFSLLIALVGCASQPAPDPLRPPPPDLPYRTWEIGLLAPNYMEVWVESVDILDQRGVGYYRVHGGLASIRNPPNNRGNPSGWPAKPGGGGRTTDDRHRPARDCIYTLAITGRATNLPGKNQYP